MMAEIGARVVRGPHWQWGEQDGGEGFCGTVVEVGRPGSQSTPDQTVVVQWDIGNRTNYRVGYMNAFDLRLYDNAPVGVKHAEHICDGCKKQCIYGIMWSCIQCFDFDLCTVCYMADKHDVSHSFRRVERPNTAGTPVKPRKNTPKVPLKGIFVGAKVVRGIDWDWGDQDGGRGEVGRVTEIRGWDGESSRSVATVAWSTSGITNIYRLGHKGKVDLQCEMAASCGSVYIIHLPLLSSNSEAVLDPAARSTFCVGDKVRICVDLQKLKCLQAGLEWNDKLAACIDQVGVVRRITARGDVRVHFLGMPDRWSIHPEALAKIVADDSPSVAVGAHASETIAGSACAGSFRPRPSAAHHHPRRHHVHSVGDRVTVIADETKVKQLQSRHGEWNEVMSEILGEVGVVTEVYTDCDLRVNVKGKTWTLNPLCVVPMSNTTVNYDDRTNRIFGEHDNHKRAAADHLGKSVESCPAAGDSHALPPSLVGQPGDPHTLTPALPALPSDLHAVPNGSTLHVPTSSISCSLPAANSKVMDRLIKEAAQGHLQSVKAILASNPELLECSRGGKNALQVSCHQGHLPVVSLLLDLGSSTTAMDPDGDTPLHYAAFGNQVEVLELLLRRGANVNALNCCDCTALHVAVNKQHSSCVQLLLSYNADANIQDQYGDTALHDAIAKDSVEIVEALTNWPRLDMLRCNKRGFNVLHHAALKGNNYATEKLVRRGREFVDVLKDDGFGALHLACLNGHCLVAETLLSLGRANPDLPNNKNQTPLLLAIAQGHVSLVELLVVKYHARVDCADVDGDTALHLAVHKLLQKRSAKDGHPIGKEAKFGNSEGVIECRDTSRDPQLTRQSSRDQTGVDSAPLLSASCPVLNEILSFLPGGSCPWLAVACMLVQRGASVTALNAQGVAPVQDLGVLQAIQSYTCRASSGVSSAIRLDLDMKVLDLAAECVRSCAIKPTSQRSAGHGQENVLSPAAAASNSAAQRCTSQPGSPAKLGAALPGPDPISELCLICVEGAISVRFEPCGHSVMCEECALRAKRCVHCRALVAQKVRHDGVVLPSDGARPLPTSEQLRLLELKLADIEEAHCCSICMERRRNVAFLCGHSACHICAQTLKTCHMCRQTITNRINLY